jgi:hypothetical protein
MQLAATGVWRVDRKEQSSAEVVTVPAKEPVRRAATPIVDSSGATGLQLQRELERVGCYRGDLNGGWTSATREAARTFLERVNAALPIERPDPVLLALVQSHAHKVCGTCAAGSRLSLEGLCIDAVALPKPGDSQRPLATVESAWGATTIAATGRQGASSLDEAPMALAGPKPERDASAPETTRVQPSVSRPREMRVTPRDWKSELWKNQN